MESLYWLVRPRNGKAIDRDDVSHAFTTYRASRQRARAHMLIRDFIGDENVRKHLAKHTSFVDITSTGNASIEPRQGVSKSNNNCRRLSICKNIISIWPMRRISDADHLLFQNAAEVFKQSAPNTPS